MYDDEIPLGHAQNLTNKKFGRLTPLYRIKDIKNQTRWKCKCECGNIVEIYASNLTRGATKSCGCLRADFGETKYNFKDLTGQNFGKLTVVERDWTCLDRVYWICECDCGNFTSVPTSRLTTGHT